MSLPSHQHAVHQLPPIFDATATSLKEDAERIIANTVATWDAVVDLVKVEDASWENIIVPIYEDENAKSEKRRVLTFYADVSPSKDLRDASSTTKKLFEHLEIELYSRRDMFLRVDKVMQDKENCSRLEEQSLYYLQKLHRLFQQNGCAIAEGHMHQFKTKKKRLDDLVRQCNRNFHENSAGLWLTQADLEGMPQSLISRLKSGESGSDFADHLWLPTKVPFSTPAITNAKKEATRKKIYLAIQNRMKMNVPLFREIVLLRDEIARDLEYANHAELKIADKMMETPQAVEELLSSIRSSLTTLAAQDTKDLLEIKQEDVKFRGEDATNKLYLWDLAYYSARRIETETREDSSISEYFELNNTLAKLLSMFEQLFGVGFRKEDTSDSLMWDKDVQMYSLWNVDGPKKEFLGYGYLDFFPRQGKYTHSGHYSLQQSYKKPDGSRFYPSSVLLMNYVRPTETRPTLLSLVEVRKLFHELGHLLHGVLSHTDYAALHRVDRDFVEAPSMMLEQFFWVERHIQDVSFHYSYLSPRMKEMWEATVENPSKERPMRLSEGVVHRLARANQHKAVQDQLKELFFATYDMLVHTPTSHEALEEMNLTELFNKTRSEIFNVHGDEDVGGWEWCHGQTTFRNILNRYDAGYYSYILGRVFALDIFETGFKADTMNQEAGRRYRDMIYRIGGRQAEMKTLTDYLGHSPSIGPYLIWLQGTRRSPS
ncbi:hypothetical protein F5Y16DRAFT_384503 [Xylariaceae sp. FL0255]|nr:hypothetical protein F5Y16DRAFT_384503 [Xylariaceae sp. FL0255]